MDLYAELTQLLAAFEERHIDYALCGGVALAVHGVPRATQDIDILALEESLPAVRLCAQASGFVFEAEPMDFSSGVTIVRFTKLISEQPLMLDVLIAKGPLQRVWAGRLTMPFESGQVKVVSREGLITLKLAAGRPQDIADIQRLKEIHRG
ncbi:MAG: nucleotidyl transferase AbiEii/AbiGii toxin family protein [Deltaproteobacteria bacterium]|nr:nucleotidyl transferase AbiEii/AbiGii toxin family protein [Deltaproteobacteria bacterium]